MECKTRQKMKKSERQCIVDEDISECDCERLRTDFAALRSTYQERHGFAYDNYRIGIQGEIKTEPKSFFKYVDLKKKRVGYTFVMNFEGQSGSRSEKICDLFAKLMERTYANEP
jgi:hypothetical protein